MSDEEEYNYDEDDEQEEKEEDTRSYDENGEEIEEEDEDARSEDLDELYLIYHQLNNEQGHSNNENSNNDDESDDERDDERDDGDERGDERDENDNIATGLYDRLYDIFHIHTSNEQLFSSIENNRYVRTYSNAVNNISNLGNIECPVCAETLHVNQLTNHLVYHHTTFYISLNMLMNPSLSMDDIQSVINTLNNNPINNPINTIRVDNDTYDILNRLMFSEDDNASYEDLLSLCDYIGYHKPGVNDIDQAAPILDNIERANLICNDDTCRICLEEFYQATTLRKIKICDHIFCADCIHQWFKENKTCPLCNIDVCPPEIKDTLVNNLDSVD